MYYIRRFVLIIYIVAPSDLAHADSFLVANNPGSDNIYKITIGTPPIVQDCGTLFGPGEPFAIGYLQSQRKVFAIQREQIRTRLLESSETETSTLPNLEYVLPSRTRVSRSGRWIYSTGSVAGQPPDQGILIDTQDASLIYDMADPWALYEATFSPSSDSLLYLRSNVLYSFQLPNGPLSSVGLLPSEAKLGMGVVIFENNTYAYAATVSDSASLYRVVGIEAEHLVDFIGQPINGNPADTTWYFYDYDTETVHAWNMDTEVETSFSAKFRDHLEPGQFTPNTGESFQTYDYRFDDCFILEPPRYDAAYASPSGHYLIFAYGSEPKCSGYVSIYDLTTSTWHAPIRIGPEDSAGLTNIVFLPEE